jgi:hypothetical protein
MLLCFFERKHLNESKKKVSVSTCALHAEKKHLKKANKHFQSETKYKNSISYFNLYQKEYLLWRVIF